MDEQATTGMTDTELDAFAERIADWARGLTPSERDLWDAMLVRAAIPQAEVSGFLLPAVLNLSAYTSSPMDPLINTAGNQIVPSFGRAEALAGNVLRKLHQS